MSSSSSLSRAEEIECEIFADAECDRIRPRNRQAYKMTVLTRVLKERIEQNELQRALQERFLESALAANTTPATRVLEEHSSHEFVSSDPAERRAARERGLLLAKMEREQEIDYSPAST